MAPYWNKSEDVMKMDAKRRSHWRRVGSPPGQPGVLTGREETQRHIQGGSQLRTETAMGGMRPQATSTEDGQQGQRLRETREGPPGTIRGSAAPWTAWFQTPVPQNARE